MSNPRLGRGLLLLSVVALIIVLVALVATVAIAQAQVVERLWAIDPHTGIVVEDLNDRHPVFTVTYERHVELLLPIFVLASVCVFGISARLWIVGRAHQARLILVVAPVLVPVLATLGTALLAGRWNQPTLEDIHEWISSEELHHLMSSVGKLEPCSRLLAFDTVFSLASTMILVVTTMILVPAMIVAWRTGAQARLAKGWSRAAIVCFLLGAVALASTRTHRADRTQVLATCTERDDPRNVHWIDGSPAELQGMEVELCISPPAWAQLDDLNLRSAYQVYANGDLIQFVPGVQESGPFEPAGAFARDGRWSRDPVISLFVDEATPVSVLTEILKAARDAEIEAVLLLGTSTLSGEFATLGPWRRRVHCGLGVLRFDDPTRNIHEFESFAEFATAASVDGGLRLDLGPRVQVTPP